MKNEPNVSTKGQTHLRCKLCFYYILDSHHHLSWRKKLQMYARLWCALLSYLVETQRKEQFREGKIQLGHCIDSSLGKGGIISKFSCDTVLSCPPFSTINVYLKQPINSFQHENCNLLKITKFFVWLYICGRLDNLSIENWPFYTGYETNNSDKISQSHITFLT